MSVAIWHLLRKRYDSVRARYQLAYPGEEPPVMPDSGDPNDGVMVIDRMLAKLEGRSPLRIKRDA